MGQGQWGGDVIAATLHKVATNLGDHAETIMQAVEVHEDETVGAMMQRLIPVGIKWRPRQYEHYVTLQFVLPAATLDNDQDAASVAGEPF